MKWDEAGQQKTLKGSLKFTTGHVTNALIIDSPPSEGFSIARVQNAGSHGQCLNLM